MSKSQTGEQSGRGPLIAIAVVLGLLVIGLVGKFALTGGQVGAEGGEEAAVQMDLLGTPEGKPGPAGQPRQPTNPNATGPEDLLGTTR